jgi:putative SOS response-associated peptidase YedK
MCGRYHLTATPENIVAHFQLQRPPRNQPNFNISPAQKILCIVELDDGSRKAVNLFWGLVPSWAKDTKISSHLINARAETIREKPSFRAAFHKRRCLIVATGFYEWQKRPSGKQAYNLHRTDNNLFAFAGLWEHWQHDQETLYSCTIITTAATDLMQPIHERMPVIITGDQYDYWLNKAASEAETYQLLSNNAYADMTATAISDYVNNPRHNDADCLQPINFMD